MAIRDLNLVKNNLLSPFIATSLNILILVLLYSCARIEYLVENWSYFHQNISDGSILKLLWGGMVFDTPGIFYSNALYIFLMLLPCHIKEETRWYKFCKWFFIIVNSFLLAINIADSVYFSYTLKRTTWSIFSEFGRESFIKIILTEFIRHWYLILVLGFMIWTMWKLYIQPSTSVSRSNLILYYILSFIALAVAAVTVIGGIRGGFIRHWYFYLIALPFIWIGWRCWRTSQNPAFLKRIGLVMMIIAGCLICVAPIGGWRHRDIRPINLSNANAYVSRPVESALVLNTTFSMLRSISKDAFSDPHYFDDKTLLDKIYSPIHFPKDSLYNPHNKNLVVIIIESFGREYIGGMNHDILGVEYKGFTPFTDSLLNHSVWWKYSYDNSQKSIDGMPAVLASIPKFERSFISTPQAMNKIKGIPALLTEKGYSTAFFHGARTGSMGFNGFARSIGFEKYYGREDFEKDSRFHGENDFDGYWAIWDEEFLQYYALKMTEMKPPFMTAIFTASNHHPFNVPDRYKGHFPMGTMKIHQTAGYTDNALRQFFNTAAKQPWFENTIFVITNDHTNMRAYDEYRSDIGSFYGPIIIYDPSGVIQPGERMGIAQQIDIMPTMMNYLGYDKPYIAFGNDLFDGSGQSRWAVNHINGIYQYISDGYILQFDGAKSIGLYAIDDHKMKSNLINDPSLKDIIIKSETKLKGVIQSYMDRMLQDKLVIDNIHK